MQGVRYNRFFRTDLSLIHCLELLRVASDDIVVKSAYQTATEAEQSPYASSYARAGLALVLGRAASSDGPATGLRLAVEVLYTCAPVVADGGSLLGLRLYRNSVALFHVRKSTLPVRDAIPAVTEWQQTPLAFATAASNTGLTSAEFDRYLRTGIPLSTGCSEAQAAIKEGGEVQPAGFDPSYSYPVDVDRRRKRREIDPVFDFCESSKEARETLVTTSWQEIDQMAANNQISASVKKRLPQAKTAFTECVTLCNDVGANLDLETNTEMQQLDASCSEAVRRMPQRFGSRSEVTDSCHLYRLSGVNNNYRTQRMRDNACTMGLCLDETPVFAFWERVFSTTFTPMIDELEGDPEPLWSEDQPTPIFKVLQETFAMECRGTVVVWAVDSQDIARLSNMLKGLFVLNTAITKVDIRCDAAEKIAIQDTLADLIEGWQTAECESPRMLMTFYTVTSLDEYDSEDAPGAVEEPPVPTPEAETP